MSSIDIKFQLYQHTTNIGSYGYMNGTIILLSSLRHIVTATSYTHMTLQAISRNNRLKYSLRVGAYYGKCPMIKVAMQGYHSYPYCNYSMCKCQFITFKN